MMTVCRRFVAIAVLAVVSGAIRADEPKPISPEQFDKLAKQVKPQTGESRFWSISWQLSLDDAIQKGAATGKPIFVWSGAGGPPHTVC